MYQARLPAFMRDDANLGRTLSALGLGFIDAMRHYAAQHQLNIEGLPQDLTADIPPEHLVEAMPGFLGTFFPHLSGTTPVASEQDAS